MLLEMLPNLNFMEGASFYDSNQYLHSQTWSSVGMQVTWDLFNLASTPKKLAAAKLEKEVVHSRRLAYSMAAITQLRLALQSYHLSKRDLGIATDLNRLHARKVQQAESDKTNVNNTDIKRIKQRSEALEARMKQGMAYAATQSALGRIHLTMGVDPLPLNGNLDLADIKTTAGIIAMRQASVTSAVISDIPQAMLAARAAPVITGFGGATDTGSLDKGNPAPFWQTLEQFSAEIERQQKWNEELGRQIAPANAVAHQAQRMPAGNVAAMPQMPQQAGQPPMMVMPQSASLPPQPMVLEAVPVTLTAD